MRTASFVALLAGLLASSASMASAQTQTSPYGSFFPAQPKKAAKPPIVFPAPFFPQPRAGASQASASAPKVTCGMTMIPADSKTDAAILRTVPELGPQYTMQIAPPSICRQ
jgi:hypothetical protein